MNNDKNYSLVVMLLGVLMLIIGEYGKTIEDTVIGIVVLIIAIVMIARKFKRIFKTL